MIEGPGTWGPGHITLSADHYCCSQHRDAYVGRMLVAAPARPLGTDLLGENVVSIVEDSL